MRSRHRWVIAVWAAVLLAGCASTPSPREGARLSPEARGYLIEALDLMQQQSLRRAEVDWKAVRAQAFDRAGDARTAAETYPAIEGALVALGDHHSRFFPPARAGQVYGDPDVVNAPTARQLPNRIGYLALPPVNGSDRTYAEYVRQGRIAAAATDRAGACGRVVDLRDETGGGMWAPLAVAAPISGTARPAASPPRTASGPCGRSAAVRRTWTTPRRPGRVLDIGQHRCCQGGVIGAATPRCAAGLFERATAWVAGLGEGRPGSRVTREATCREPSASGRSRVYFSGYCS
ncbi:peptidase S41 [Kitasatospora cathayae]|uniref:Peptidase S41 n=1 Tax=Kitasatospora cathayae TaxID=3004092 RepID=A0ABY7QEP3_9ACTN|nr:peptidase S41 [Kitasatospora sp. HUAS 3-15]WBP91229.1 peptidase S41 [Kitasatospora sp. HUAS 3-15]